MRKLILCFCLFASSAFANTGGDGLQEQESVSLKQMNVLQVIVYDAETKQAVCAISPASHPEVVSEQVGGVDDKTSELGLPACSDEVTEFVAQNKEAPMGTQVAGLGQWAGACIGGALISGGVTLGTAVSTLLGLGTGSSVYILSKTFEGENREAFGRAILATVCGAAGAAVVVTLQTMSH